MTTPHRALRGLTGPALVVLAAGCEASPARAADETPAGSAVGPRGVSSTFEPEGIGPNVRGAWVQLLLDRGVVFIALDGGLPGPVWFPTEEGEVEGGVEVHGELDPGTGTAQVHFGRIGRHLRVEALCSYGLPTRDRWGRKGGFEPHEIACLPGWRLSTGTPPPTPAGCGSCGLGVLCCPGPGECLGCGLCGRVCRGAMEGERQGREG